jgi:hypothetical protein
MNRWSSLRLTGCPVENLPTIASASKKIEAGILRATGV